MRKEECFFLGTLSSLYSYKGEILINIDSDEPELYTQLESILVDYPTGLVPFFISGARLHKSRFLRVKLVTIDTEESAQALLKKKVYLPLSMLPPLEGNRFYYHEIIGFTALDVERGVIGTIEGVNDQSSQALLKISDKEKQQLIPIHDDFILKIDRNKKEFHLNLPPGILSLND